MPRVTTDDYGETVTAPTPLRLTPPPPPVQQTQVVDRVAYLQQQADEARQLEEALRQQQEFERQRLQSALQTALPQLIQQGIDIAPSMLGNALPNVRVADFASEQEAIREAQRRSDLGIPNVRVVFPSEEMSPFAGVGDIGRVAGNIAGPLTNEIPGAQRVADVAGNLGERVGRTALQGAMGPAGVAEKLLPEQYRPSTIAGNVTGFAAETLVPTEVWQAALELIPGIGSVPELVRAFKAGTPEAITAVTRAGERIGAREDVQRAIKMLASERGSLELPEREARIASLEEQRSNIGRALKSLRGTEASRVEGGTVDDVMKVAARYDSTSEQRKALIQAIEPKIAHLPDAQQQFIKASLEVLPSNAERRAALEALHTRQAASSADVFERGTGTIQERATAAFGAMKGPQAQRFTPIGDRFSADTTAELFRGIEDAASAGKISRFFEPVRATDALTLLMTGQRLPGSGKGLNLEPNEVKLLGKIFGPEFETAIPKTAAHLSKFAQFVDLLNFPRALVTALDFSAAGRQGILLAARNPVEWTKSLLPMIKAMATEEGFNRGALNIQRNGKYEDALRHGLELTDIGGGVQGEEAFASRLASKFPFIRGSERGYVMFLDNLRMLTYEKYANRLERLAEKQGWDVARTSMVKQNIAKFLNVASGRGDLKFAQEFTPALNAIFFSPRFLVSRPQSIWAMVRPGADKFTRQVAFENLGAFVGMGVGMLEIAKLMGADVEVDPRSSDFGKMRFGNTRIDFWGGYQPIARYVAQFATGENKELFTGDVNKVYRGTTALRFFRSKLAPSGSMIYDYTVGEGKTYNGDDVFFQSPGWQSAWNDFGKRVLPLSMQDAITGYKTGGVRGALVSGGVSAAGGGVSSFEPTEKQQEKVQSSGFQKKLSEAGFPTAEQRYGNWKSRIADDVGAPAAQFSTITDLKSDFVDKTWQSYKLPEKEGRAAAASAFERFASVKEYRKAQQADELRFWRDHPALLKEGRDAGEIQLSKSEREELGLD